MIDISIIIVNYNVKEYLASLLNSIKRSQGKYSLEIFVVDNASVDGSIPYLRKEFPDVHYIANTKNVGFGKANNQAIKKAKGTYTLIINPDTIVSEDTLDVMYRHMEENTNTAVAGCKLLNPDGSFAPESRRQVPTPAIAVWKALGITSLFPKSKRFAGYYMNWLDEDEPSQVPVLSGSFMFFRTSVLQEMKGFDEDFFMYGEDIDLCYRVTQAGYDIDYVPSTSIIHYKGESTRKGGLDYHIIFNKSNYLFFRKHFSLGYSMLFRFIVLLGVIANTALNYLKSLFTRSLEMISDVVFANLLIVGLFLLRYSIHPEDILEEYEWNYLAVNGLYTLTHLILAKYYNLYRSEGYRSITLVKICISSFAVIALITFFWRDFAFSRWILIWGAVAAPVLLLLTRLLLFDSRKKSKPNSVTPTRIVLAGIDENTAKLIKRIRSQVEWNYEIVGIITQDESYLDKTIENIPVISQLPLHSGILEYYKVQQVFFLIPAMNYKDILKAMSQLRNPDIITKLVPDSMEYIIGKTNVEYMDDMPVMDLKLEYQQAWNRFIKRQFDWFVSFILLILLGPLALIQHPFLSRKRVAHPVYSGEENRLELRLVADYRRYRTYNYAVLLWHVFIGKISLVGAPLTDLSSRSFIHYKSGITGLRQINENRVYHQEEKERFEMYYLQNYCIWLDVEVIFKSMMAKSSPLEYMSKISNNN